MQPAVTHLSIGSDGKIAASAQAAHKGALYCGGGLCDGMAQWLDKGAHVRLVADFEGERALARRGQHLLHREIGHAPCKSLLHTQAMQPGSGEDDGIIVARVELAQAGIDIATQRQYLRVRHERAYLRSAPQATGADAQGKSIERGGKGPRRLSRRGNGFVPHQRVANILALTGDDHTQAVRLRGGQVLQTMHGEINTPLQESALDFEDKDAIASNRGERRAGIAITRRVNLLDADLQVGPMQSFDDPTRLYHRQLAGPRANG